MENQTKNFFEIFQKNKNEIAELIQKLPTRQQKEALELINNLGKKLKVIRDWKKLFKLFLGKVDTSLDTFFGNFLTNGYKDKLNKKSYSKLHSLFIKPLLEAFYITELNESEINKQYVSQKHELIKDSGGTSGIIKAVLNPGYMYKKDGDTEFIKANVEL